MWNVHEQISTPQNLKKIFVQYKEKELNKNLFSIKDRLNIVQDSFFFYDKSNLAKETFIAQLNKYIALYRAIPYFSEKEEKTLLTLLIQKQKISFSINRKYNKEKILLQINKLNGELTKLKKIRKQTLEF